MCIRDRVDNYVNVRSTPGEDGEVLGKLYDKSAATVEGEENAVSYTHLDVYKRQDFSNCTAKYCSCNLRSNLSEKLDSLVQPVNTLFFKSCCVIVDAPSEK